MEDFLVSPLHGFDSQFCGTDWENQKLTTLEPLGSNPASGTSNLRSSRV